MIKECVMAGFLTLSSCAQYELATRVAGAVMCGGAFVGDEITTIEIAHAPGRYERNPILGRHPANTYTIVYFGVWLGLDVLINVFAPLWIAIPFDAACTGIESYETAHNIGILSGK